VTAAEDGAALAAIYAPAILDSSTSFEEVVPTAEEMAVRVARMQAMHLWLVAEVEGQVAGYAYAGPFRARAAYAWSTETAVYVGAGHQRSGVGRRLYTELLKRITSMGYRQAIAGITLPNEASVKFHESFGFEPAGIFHRVGWKQGQWWDVGFWEKQLGPDGSTPPDPR